MRRSQLGYALILIGLATPSVAAFVWGQTLPPGGRSLTPDELLVARWGLPISAVASLIGVVAAWTAARSSRSLATTWFLLCSTGAPGLLLVLWALFFL